MRQLTSNPQRLVEEIIQLHSEGKLTKEQIQTLSEALKPRKNKSWSEAYTAIHDLFKSQGWVSQQQIDDALKQVNPSFDRKYRQRALSFLKKHEGDLSKENKIFRRQDDDPLSFLKEGNLHDTFSIEPKAKSLGVKQLELIKKAEAQGWTTTNGGKTMKKVRR